MMGLLLSMRQRHAFADPWRPLPPSVVSQFASLTETFPRQASGPRTLALVSAGRRAGTSTCIINLARALADRGNNVLMVDANAPHPALHELMAIRADPGLADVLRGDMLCAAAIQPTSLPRVSLLTAGDRSTDEARSPAAATLRDAVLEHAAAFDFVLVDCPAVNVYQEAARTAAQCDAAIIVLHAGQTARQEAQAAKRLLTRGNCRLLGVFLNRRKFYIPRFIYERL
jgi:polysaccharide biosynthesis transport protein